MMKVDSDLRTGDIERVRLEWRSLLRHLSHAPDLNWDRWLELKKAAKEAITHFPREPGLEDLPQLTPRQQQRHKSFLVFDERSPA